MPFTVIGVVEGAETDLDKQAQGEYYSVYVPMKAFQQKSSSSVKSAEKPDKGDKASADSGAAAQGTRVVCYEVVMPNPIENYALNAVAEAVGIEFKTDEEKEKARSFLNFGEKEIVDNTARYSFFNLLNRDEAEEYIDMKTNDIVYPYWENLARYEESKQRSALTVVLILLIIPVLSLVYLICFLYSNRRVALIPFKKIKSKLDEKSEARKYKLMEQRQQERLEEEKREHEARMQHELSKSGETTGQEVTGQEVTGQEVIGQEVIEQEMTEQK